MMKDQLEKIVELTTKLQGELSYLEDRVEETYCNANLVDQHREAILGAVRGVLNKPGCTVRMSEHRAVDRCRFGEPGLGAFGPTTFMLVITYDEGRVR